MRAEPPARASDTLRRSPTPLLLGQQTNTPRPGSGSGKLPAASAQGSQTRSGGSKQPTVQGRGTKQLYPQGVSDAPEPAKQPNGKNGGSGKLPAAIPVGVASVAAAAALGCRFRVCPCQRVIRPECRGCATGTPGGPGMGQRQVALTPLPPPVSRRRTRAWT